MNYRHLTSGNEYAAAIRRQLRQGGPAAKSAKQPSPFRWDFERKAEKRERLAKLLKGNK